MRVESREVEIAGEQEDHGANLGDPALIARLAHIPRCGNTYGTYQMSFQTWWSDRPSAGTLLHECPLNFQQRFLDIADVCVMAAVHLTDSQT
jgi:hypothetical protein